MPSNNGYRGPMTSAMDIGDDNRHGEDPLTFGLFYAGDSYRQHQQQQQQQQHLRHSQDNGRNYLESIVLPASPSSSFFGAAAGACSPAKTDQHLIENQFETAYSSTMARRCLKLVLIVSLAVFMLSSAGLALLYGKQRLEQRRDFQYNPSSVEKTVLSGRGGGPRRSGEHSHYRPASEFKSLEADVLPGRPRSKPVEPCTRPVSGVHAPQDPKKINSTHPSGNGVVEEHPATGARVESIPPRPPSLLPSYDTLLSNELANPRKEYFTHWLPDDTLVIRDAGGNWVHLPATYSSNNGSSGNNNEALIPKGEIFLSSEEIDPYAIRRFSSDYRYVAVGSQVESIYRHSNKALYKVGRYIPGRTDAAGNSIPGRIENFTWVGALNNGEQRLQLVEWNPTYGAEDLVYVYENNIYYQADPRHPESAFPLTSGASKFRFFGVSDWLYEEEVLQGSKALWWSKSGRYLAYGLFDDENVTRLHIPNYYAHSSYPVYEEVAYPKVGLDTAQPRVFLWVWDRVANTTRLIHPPEELEQPHHHGYYLFDVNWMQIENAAGASGDSASGQVDEDHLIVTWANRAQDYVVITLCRYHSPCQVLHRVDFADTAAHNGMRLWAEPTDFDSSQQSPTGFFVLLPHAHSDGNVYNWVAHIDVASAIAGLSGSVTAMHGGPWDISELSSYNRERDELFFYSRGDSIASRRLYRVSTAAGARQSVTPQCVSCVLVEEQCGGGGASSRAYFSPNSRRFVLACEAAYQQPKLFVKSVADITSRGTPIPYHPQPAMSYDHAFSAPTIRLERITTSLGYEAYLRIVYPPSFQPNKRYPVVLELYAGPNSAEVNDYTPSYLITNWAQRGYIVVTVDGRGTNYRGWRLKSPIHGNLGGPEIDDQLDVLRQLLDRHSDVMDRDNVASFGWSYGGFASLGIGLKDAGRTVQCVMAVAPVTDYHFYDSAYTERYMGLPEQNQLGYTFTQLHSADRIDALANLRGLLLAHGEADDNVNYQNSALLARELQARSIHFTQLVYANEDHSIGGLTRHLYGEFDRFIDGCFTRK